MIEVGLVPPEKVPRLRNALTPLIARLTRLSDDWPIDRVIAEAGAGRLDLWFGIDGGRLAMVAGCLRQETASGKPVYWVEFVAGENLGRYGRPILAEIKTFARANNARIEAKGRLGWKRWEKHLGLRRKAIIYEVED